MRRLRLPNPFDLPLLAKELIEQAARKRTYVIRCGYVLVLFILVMVVYRETLIHHNINDEYFVMLGGGGRLFEALVFVQFAGIVLFLPALMAGAIAQEKERNTLVLLMVTDLRPGQIIMQKYLGRLVPMFSFLLLSLPLMAVAYSMGGVSSGMIASAALLLVVQCLQWGALALMFSAWCRSTVAAYLLTYLLGAGFYLFPVLAGELMQRVGVIRWDAVWHYSLVPPLIFDAAGGDFPRTCRLSVPALASVIVFLADARLYLVRRAFIEPRNLLLRWFRVLDVFYQKLNVVTGNVMLFHDGQQLPDDRPIAWWEVTRRALGRPHYLFRILTVAMTPVLLLIGAAVMGQTGRRDTREALTMVIFAFWVGSALVVIVQAASTFTLDRSRQTLDVLLAVPLTGRRIVLEKTAALQRLVLVLWVPLFTLALFKGWWQKGVMREYEDLTANQAYWLYVICAGLAIVIYLPLTAWCAMWIGLMIRNQTRAMVTAVAVMVAWCAAPFLAWDFLSNIGYQQHWLVLASPAAIIAVNEFHGLNELSSRILDAVVLNFAWYAFLAWLLRHLCLRRADHYLGRIVEPRCEGAEA